MKKYIIANWKANKSYDEAQEWIAMFSSLIKEDSAVQEKLESDALHIIICPPAPFIFSLANAVSEMKNITIGAQDISAYEEGAYTGEVTVKSIEFGAGCTLLGHSERRSLFNETEETLAKKVALAKKYTIDPILCIRGTQDTIHEGVAMIAYEPVEAIGTGKNMSAAEVLEKKKTFTLPQDCIFIYGGSVNEQTCTEYLQSDEIHGLLVGGASLVPETFLGIIRKV